MKNKNWAITRTKVSFTQLSFKTHQKYNTRIDKLLSLGYRVYVTAYLPLGSFSLRYKVHLSLLEALLFGQDVYVINVTKFKLGLTRPKSYWGKVELGAMLALQSNTFIQTIFTVWYRAETEQARSSFSFN